MSVVSVPQPDTAPTWDPGGLFTIRNTHMYSVIVSAMDAAVVASLGDDPMGDDEEPGPESRTDLDSHANMPVVGKEAYVLAWLDKSVEVSPYTPDYKPMSIPLVDAAVRYDCPYDGKVYILVIRNALYVPAMDHNLILPFIMREAGVKVKAMRTMAPEARSR